MNSWEKRLDEFISNNEVRWEESNCGDISVRAIPQLKNLISDIIKDETKELMEKMRGIGCIGCHKKNIYELEQELQNN